MGLFSSKTRYYAFSANGHVIDREDYPHTLKSMVLSAAMHQEEDMVENILIGNITGLPAQVRTMIRYAKKKYVRGLPSATFTGYRLDEEELKDTIAKLYNVNDINGDPDPDDVEVSFSLLGYRDLDFTLEKWLSENYLNPSRFPWIMNPGPRDPPLPGPWSAHTKNMLIPLIDRGFFGNKRYTAVKNSYVTRFTSSNNHIQLGWQWSYQEPDWDGGGGTVSGTWYHNGSINLDSFTSTGQRDGYIHVRWNRKSDAAKTNHYIVTNVSNADWAHFKPSSQDMAFSDYMPIAILLRDTDRFDKTPTSALAKTTNGLLKKIKLNGTKFLNDFIKADTEKADKWDIYVHFGADLNSPNQSTRWYIFEFFKYLNGISTDSVQDYQSWISSVYTPPTWDDGGYEKPRYDGSYRPISIIKVQEGGAGGYRANYAWHFIDHKKYNGRLLTYRTTAVKRYKAKNTAGWKQFYGANTNYKIGDDYYGGSHDYVLIIRQTKKDAGEMVLIMGLSMQYEINTSKVADDLGDGLVSGTAGRLRVSEPKLFTNDPDDSQKFILPVNIGIMQELPNRHEEQVLADSLQWGLFLVQKVKTKWYQSGFFKFVVIVIAIALVINFNVLLKGVISALGVTSTAAITAVTYAFKFVVGFIVSLAGQMIGGVGGQLFTLIAGLYTGYLSGLNPGQVGSAGGFMDSIISSVKDVWSNVSMNFSFGTAFEFIRLVQPFLEFAHQIYHNNEIERIRGEMEDFTKDHQDKLQEMEDAWMGLIRPKYLDPMDIIRSPVLINSNEGPDAFYRRLLNTNPGLAVLDSVQGFIPNALALPETGSGTIIDAQYSSMLGGK